MTPETKQLMGEAAALIRTNLWQGTVPPPSPDKRPWSMGRELNIWKRLVAGGFKPEEINGAISVIRTVRPYDGKMRLTWFYWYKRGGGFGGTPLLEMCIGYWHKNVRDAERDKGRLPPSIQSLLREAIG